MFWLKIFRTHVNPQTLTAIKWDEGELSVWFIGEEKPAKWDDPDKRLYLKLCRAMDFQDDHLYPEGLRPCQVDGKPALFHRWVEEDKALLKVKAFMQQDDIDASIARFHRDGVMDHSCDIEKLHTVSALVEYEGGTVGKVNPELIRFTDREEI